MDAIGLILSSGILSQSNNIKLVAIPFPNININIPKNGTIYSDYYDILELVGANAIGIFYSEGFDIKSGEDFYYYWKYNYFYNKNATENSSEVYTRMDLYSKYMSSLSLNITNVTSTTMRYYINLILYPPQNFRYRVYGVMNSGNSSINVGLPTFTMLVAAFF